MKILACDTAIGSGSVCLLCDGEIIASIHTKEQHKQAERLIPNIEALLAEAGWKYSDLNMLATTIGAGSFTGVRIGLATVRGIALASGLKVIGVSTLQAMAYGEGACLAILNAGRGQVYAQEFDENSCPISDIILMDYENIFDKNRHCEEHCDEAIQKKTIRRQGELHLNPLPLGEGRVRVSLEHSLLQGEGRVRVSKEKASLLFPPPLGETPPLFPPPLGGRVREGVSPLFPPPLGGRVRVGVLNEKSHNEEFTKTKTIGNADIDGVLYKEPMAEDVAKYAFAHLDLATEGVNISPLYIRQPDAIPQKKG